MQPGVFGALHCVIHCSVFGLRLQSTWVSSYRMKRLLHMVDILDPYVSALLRCVSDSRLIYVSQQSFFTLLYLHFLHLEFFNTFSLLCFNIQRSFSSNQTHTMKHSFTQTSQHTLGKAVSTWVLLNVNKQAN